MKHFAALKQDLQKDITPRRIIVQQPTAKGTGTRAGKRCVSAYFSGELSKTLNLMAVEENSSVQSLLGEAIDLLMRERGKHPFGER
ncbi:MAG: ribbon-helix-helix domain-containing protein [Candidatus Sulfotelmatobacter sp.]